jgi:UDP-N-acetylmuramoyl-L-alanyl-D-glutamate--2,6-diaminopimelate ligase
MNKANPSHQPARPVFCISLAETLAILRNNKLLSPECKLKETDATSLVLEWDTRHVQTETPALFIARKGYRFDSNSHAKNLLSKGVYFCGEATAVIRQLRLQGNSESAIRAILENPRFIPIEDAQKALEILLDFALGIFPTELRSAAITGTSGKTSSAQITGYLMQQLTGKEALRMGSLGIDAGERHWENDYPTMPDLPGFFTTVRQAWDLGIRQMVFEATSHGLTERRMGQWKVDVAAFTNFSQDHLDFHKTMESYRRCKGLLFENHIKNGGSAVINADDKECAYFIKKTGTAACNIIGFGKADARNPFEKECAAKFQRTRFLEISEHVSTTKGISGCWTLYENGEKLTTAEYRVKLIGEFQHYNLATSAGILTEMGFTIDAIANAAQSVPGIPGRLEQLIVAERSPHATILVDYAHKPDALEKALSTVRTTTPNGAKLICVFGCGGDRDASKRPIMGKISTEMADLSIITSDNPRTEDPNIIIENIMNGVVPNSNVLRIVNRREAIFEAIALANKEDVIVIAGKGHENYQIVGTEKLPFSDFEVARDALMAKKL